MLDSSPDISLRNRVDASDWYGYAPLLRAPPATRLKRIRSHNIKLVVYLQGGRRVWCFDATTLKCFQVQVFEGDRRPTELEPHACPLPGSHCR